MNKAVEKHFAEAASNRHLDWLESESIHIMREVAAECSNPDLLFSGGKDSVVLLRIAEKAFRPGKFPFPLVQPNRNFPRFEIIQTGNLLSDPYKPCRVYLHHVLLKQSESKRLIPLNLLFELVDIEFFQIVLNPFYAYSLEH